MGACMYAEYICEDNAPAPSSLPDVPFFIALLLFVVGLNYIILGVWSTSALATLFH